MYAKSTRPSAKREVQKDRSAKRDHQIARPRRAQACERSTLLIVLNHKYYIKQFNLAILEGTEGKSVSLPRPL